MRMRSAVLAACAAIPLGMSLCTGAVATAHKSFDGAWSVLVVTDTGNCDRAYRYALRIINGAISYDNSAFDVSGHVDARGHVKVSIGAGGDSAVGAGRLSGDSGGGNWRGHSSTSSCAGHWEAQRRSG